MDLLGNSDDREVLDFAIDAAARRAIHDWARPMDELQDLKQDLWEWYLSRPKTQEFVAKAKTKTGIRNAFGRHAWQLLSEQRAKQNVADARAIYSSESVKLSLANQSTNKYLADILPEALAELEKQNATHAALLRRRYDDREVFGRQSAEQKMLVRAHESVTAIVNRIAITDMEGEKDTTKRGAQAAGRRVSGVHSDPTADMALSMIKAGDDAIELADGTVTSMRKLFETESLPIGAGGDNPGPLWAGLDLFEGEINDRTDMYRGQVFPELYPDELPMLVENWHPEDQAAYCGGEYTEGYRRLKVVR